MNIPLLFLFSRVNAKSPLSVTAKEAEVDVIGFTAGFRGRFPLDDDSRGITNVKVKALIRTALKIGYSVGRGSKLLVGDAHLLQAGPRTSLFGQRRGVFASHNRPLSDEVARVQMR